MTGHHIQRTEEVDSHVTLPGASAFDFIARAVTSIPEPEANGTAVVQDGSRSPNSLGVSASWKNPEVLASRITRNGVRVTLDGNSREFRSLRAAFTHFRLPQSKHIRFRQIVKSDLEATFTYGGKTYLFTLLE